MGACAIDKGNKNYLKASEDLEFALKVWKRHWDNGNLQDNYCAGESIYTCAKEYLEEQLKQKEEITGYLKRIMPHLNEVVNIINSMAVGVLDEEMEVVTAYKLEISEKAKKLVQSNEV